MKPIVAVFIVLVLAACSQRRLSAAGGVVGELTSDSLVQLRVCARLKPGTTEAQIQQHTRGCETWKDSSPYSLSYRAATTVAAHLPNRGDYDVMHYTAYRSEQTIRLYALHPVHQRFIQQ